jgi:competence protein ComEC
MSADPAPADASWRDLGQSIAEAVGFRPLVYLTVAALLGIAWADWARPPYQVLGVLALLAAAVAIGIRGFAATWSRAFAVAALFLVGAVLHAYRLTPGRHDLTRAPGRELAAVSATVLRIQRGELQERAIVVAATAGPYRGRALLSGRAARGRLEVGQRLVLRQVTVEPLTWGGGPLSAATGALRRDGIHCRLTPREVAPDSTPAPEPGRLQRWSMALGQRMQHVLATAMPGSNAQTYSELLAGMVYGQRAAPVGREMQTLFRRSGTAHLLVVSGAQITILAFSLVFLLRGGRRVLPLWGIPLVALGLAGFALVSGLGASVTRAVAMQLLLLCSFAWGRRYDLPASLALAALGLCLADTSALFEAGPQLTYACTIGVYLALPPARRDRRAGRAVAALQLALWGSAGAWLFSLPILAGHFRQVVLLGAIANLIAVPLSVVTLYLGLLAIGLGLLWTPLAVPCCLAARCVLDLLLRSNQFFAAIPGAVLEGVRMGPWLAVAWYLGATALLLVWRTRRPRPAAEPASRSWAFTVGALLLGALALGYGAVHRAAHGVEVHVLDVGAAQCLLIRGPTGAGVMVDAGTQVAGAEPGLVARRQLLPYLALHGVRELGALVISHPHADHCNLAASVLRGVPVQRLLVGPELAADAAWQEALSVAQRAGLQWDHTQAGGCLDLGGGAVLEVLAPSRLLSGTADDANNNNLVLRLAYGATSVLIPCDLQTEGEAELLVRLAARPVALRSTVLIAAHHGSRYSNSEAFVRAVAPQVVVLSCGSGYQAPRPEGLAVFQRLGSPVWRTDESGTVVLRLDGRRVHVTGSR